MDRALCDRRGWTTTPNRSSPRRDGHREEDQARTRRAVCPLDLTRSSLPTAAPSPRGSIGCSRGPLDHGVHPFCHRILRVAQRTHTTPTSPGRLLSPAAGARHPRSRPGLMGPRRSPTCAFGRAAEPSATPDAADRRPGPSDERSATGRTPLGRTNGVEPSGECSRVPAARSPGRSAWVLGVFGPVDPALRHESNRKGRLLDVVSCDDPGRPTPGRRKDTERCIA